MTVDDSNRPVVRCTVCFFPSIININEMKYNVIRQIYFCIYIISNYRLLKQFVISMFESKIIIVVIIIDDNDNAYIHKCIVLVECRYKMVVLATSRTFSCLKEINLTSSHMSINLLLITDIIGLHFIAQLG